MLIRTVGELCERIRRDPKRALGARSPRTLGAYLLGYATAVEHHRTAQLVDETGGEFREWVTAQIKLTSEHGSRLNASSAFAEDSIALLASEDEHDAFETWLDLRARCIADLKGATAPVPHLSLGDHGLFSLLAEVRRRPGMFFGNSYVENVWALINGYTDAESDHGALSPETATMTGFQQWIDERYPFGRGQPWFRVFRLLAINPDRGCEVFFCELDLFISGDPPDTPDPAMTTMIDAILEHGRRLSDKKRKRHPPGKKRSRGSRVKQRRRAGDNRRSTGARGASS